MILRRTCCLLAFAAYLLIAHASIAAAQSNTAILTYHAGAARSGNYVVPGLTWQRAATAHRDQAFDGKVQGEIYAQPLYWRPQGAARGLIIVATEAATVYALDPQSGRQVWQQRLGAPVPGSSLPCGNIDPVGITGTPVIDPQSGTLYVDALIEDRGTPRHLVFGLRLSDGAILRGWPVDIESGLRAKGIGFQPRVQNQRGALALVDGRLYVPFGGNFGDCGSYHGAVVGLTLGQPSVFGAWITRASKAGIWAPGGVVSDGQSLFVATGNARDGREWADQEAVIRLSPDLHHSAVPRDFFAPSDWRALDERDADLGGTNPVPIDLPEAKGSRPLMLILGKDGNAYLLDRLNLGGIGGALVTQRVARGSIITAPVVYPAPQGAFVAFPAPGAFCPGGEMGGEMGGETAGLAALSVSANPAPRMSVAWCAPLRALRPVPAVTTTNGSAEPIVWVAGDRRLHGFRGDTGQPVFTGGGDADGMAGLHHFTAILPAEGRLYVTANQRLYAFRFGAP